MADKPIPEQSAPDRRPKRWTRKALVGMVVAGGAVVVHIGYRGSQVDPRIYTADDLKSGPVAQIIVWDQSHSGVQISRFSPLQPDHVWRVVTDQARFDEFMPYVQSTTIRPGQDGAILEKQVLNLPHANYDLELEIRLSAQGDQRTARWKQVVGALTFNEGAWIVERAGEGSVLRYQVSAELSWVPQCVVNYAMLHRLGTLLEAVERRVRALEQSEPEYFHG